jgi:hypothetical protein
MGEAATETGIKWWMRYIVVPLIGGGGLIALVVALVEKPKVPIEPTKNVAIGPASSGLQNSEPVAATGNTKKDGDKGKKKPEMKKEVRAGFQAKTNDAPSTSKVTDREEKPTMPKSLEDRIDRVTFNLFSDTRGLVKSGDPPFRPYEKLIISWDATAVSEYGAVRMKWGIQGENEESWRNVSGDIRGRQELVCGPTGHKLTFVLNLELRAKNVLRLGRIDTECLGSGN